MRQWPVPDLTVDRNQWTQLGFAVLVLVLLLVGSVLGMGLQRRLPDHHRSRDTIDSARLVITMLVTFAALVLGLLVSAVKTDFDRDTNALRAYGVSLIELDQRLRQYGPEAMPIRAELREFAASVLADGWPDEPRPTGPIVSGSNKWIAGSNETAEITALLMKLDLEIHSLMGTNPVQQRIAAISQALIRTIEQQRWTVIEIDHPTVSWPFLVLLFIVFLLFDLSSPPNVLVLVVIGFSAVSVTSAMYLIMDLDTRLSGYIKMSSQPIRDALLHMDRP